MIERVISELVEEGVSVNVSTVCAVLEYPRRSFYYREKHRQRAVNEPLAGRIRRVIDALPYAGYRTSGLAAGREQEHCAADLPDQALAGQEAKVGPTASGAVPALGGHPAE